MVGVVGGKRRAGEHVVNRKEGSFLRAVLAR